LLINPHTSFFFRAEAQMVSDAGLNAYGALTWGQFFVYQGFNDRAGWMHTSSNVENIDEYLETVEKGDDGSYRYRVGTEQRRLEASTISVPYKSATGMATRQFTVYKTHRGPIVRAIDGKWVSVRMMHSPRVALTQSYLRTKARNLEQYKRVMALPSLDGFFRPSRICPDVCTTFAKSPSHRLAWAHLLGALRNFAIEIDSQIV
jgi:acyl-homoserine-lactone acylase